MNKIIAAFTVVLLTSAYQRSDTIKIGTIMPLSGVIAEYGIAIRNAALLAVEEINATVGLLGRQVELVVEDDHLDPRLTVNSFTKLVRQDKVVAIMGALTSRCSLSISRMAVQQNIPMISPTSTNDTVTLAGDFVFRACYTDSFQGNVVANYARETLGVKKAAILYDVSNGYSVGLFNQFKASFEAMGGVVFAESYNSGDKDFNAQITKLRTGSPDVIFLPDYYSTVVLIAQQIREQGVSVPLLGADGWDEFDGKTDTWMIPAFYSTHFRAENTTPEVVTFVAAYKARFGSVPNALSALGYDATRILLMAIQAAGSTHPAAIRDAMKNISGKFVTGNISFDANRNPVKSAVIVEVVAAEDGTLTTRYAGTVNP